jgi:hypothetical protein
VGFGGEVDGVTLVRLGLAAGTGLLVLMAVLGVRGAMALEHIEANAAAHSHAATDHRSTHHSEPMGLRRTNWVGPG